MRELSTLVGKNIRQFRRIAGLTQEQLASKTGLSSDYISRLELGKENPGLDVLWKIGKALGVGVQRFMDVER